MTISASQLLPIFLALVTLFSPPSVVGPIAAMYSVFDRPDQRKIAGCWAKPDEICSRRSVASC